MAQTRYTQNQIIEAITESSGILSEAARLLGCSRQTIYDRMEKSKAIKKAYDDATEIILDKAKSKLLEKIEEGDTTAIIFTLKTKGKHDGWSERPSVEIHNQNTSNTGVLISHTPDEVNQYFEDKRKAFELEQEGGGNDH